MPNNSLHLREILKKKSDFTKLKKEGTKVERNPTRTGSLLKFKEYLQDIIDKLAR
jgi:hypothetical protein